MIGKVMGRYSLLRIQRGFRRRFGASYVGRNLTVLPDDIFLTSYPKSGNTWTRFLIANLSFATENIDFTNIERKIPDIYQNLDKNLLQLPTPRLLKSHEYLDPRYKKVLCIVRDPRDVLLSSYYHCLKFETINNSVSVEAFADKFIAGEIYFVGAQNPIGSWADNVGSWLGARQNDPNFLLVRYEDLKLNTAKELRRISTFLQIDSSDAVIERAVTRSSADSMRQLEKQNTNVWPNKQSRKDISFVRSAKAGGWKKNLPASVSQSLESEWKTTMRALDYIS
ncbi:sulfotransferase domain-containing protein [Leptolyngbya sp. BC1307]|uniref:sulfotransferase domain-containing protein n=1 Tax=Leptolyngbya sp. BC1307 TaxID=2029589 RepID=UPI000EFC8F05|nr:sulfotransferase domain-containing protein [Leptolyngbya sp. BC1307]